jgi:hypothetical protein
MIDYNYIKNLINKNKTFILGLIICIALVSIVFYKKLERFTVKNEIAELASMAEKEEKEAWQRDLFCTKGCGEDKNIRALFQKVAETNQKKFCAAKCLSKIKINSLMDDCNKEKCIKGRIAGVARDNCLKNKEFTGDCLTQMFGNCSLQEN